MSAAPNIAILGAGFAAIACARALRRLRPRACIRLIAPERRFVYRPSLIWIPIGLRKANDIQVSLGALLERHRLDFTPASVTGIADGGRTVLTGRGEVRNDALVIATGAGFDAGLPGAEHALGLCDGVEAAERVRRRLLALKRGRIAIGCGVNASEPGATRCGPMLELLFGIDTWLRRQGARARFELDFFSSCADPFKRFGHGAAERLHAELEKRGITSHAGIALRRFTAAGIESEDGALAADFVVYTPGLRGPSWLAQTDLPRSAGGFVAANEYCEVEGFANVFAAGDAGSFPGPVWSPKLAHMAQLQAGVAATNLIAVLDGDTPTTRLHHELACVIDTGESGIALFRDDANALAMPAAAPAHWAKRAVERHFLRTLAD